jgi:hypothetical protein
MLRNKGEITARCFCFAMPSPPKSQCLNAEIDALREQASDEMAERVTPPGKPLKREKEKRSKQRCI